MEIESDGDRSDGELIKLRYQRAKAKKEKPITMKFERLCSDFIYSGSDPWFIDLEMRERTYQILNPIGN